MVSSHLVGVRCAHLLLLLPLAEVKKGLRGAAGVDAPVRPVRSWVGVIDAG
jgi:hypothetical protein